MPNFILCNLDDHQFAIEISEVDKVIRAVEVSPLPDMDPCFMGVINMHGKVLGVINLREKLHFPPRELVPSDLFLIYTCNKKSIAVVIDGITGMFSCPDESLLSPQEVLPRQTVDSSVELVKYVLRHEQAIIFVYDFQKLILNMQCTASNGS